MKPMFAVLTSSVVFGEKLERRPQLLDERLGRREVLDDVEHQHVVEVAGSTGGKPSLRSWRMNAIELDARAERKLVDAGHAAAASPAQHRADVAAGAAEIEDARAGRNELERRECGLG